MTIEWVRDKHWSSARCGPLHIETQFIHGEKRWQAWAAGGCVYRATQEEAEVAAVEKAVAYARAILAGAGAAETSGRDGGDR